MTAEFSMMIPALFHLSHNVVKFSPMLQILAIVGGTLISEDVTCVFVGTLIGHHEVPWLRCGLACFLGIYIGDLAFFFLGRVAGSRMLKTRFFSRTIGEERLRHFGKMFDRRPWAAIMACRVLPGIRVPLYLSMGAVTQRTRTFFFWTCLFAFVWTPALLGAVILLGDAIKRPLDFVFGSGWWTIPVTVAILVFVIKSAITLSTSEGRGKLKHRFAQLVGRG